MKSEADVFVVNKNISIESRIENISVVEKAVDEISSELNFSTSVYGNVLISVVEVVANAIIHGNKLDKTKIVNISISCTDNNLLRFVVQDEGVGFNPDNVPDPTSLENIEKSHGRGVFLMKNLANKVVFEKNGSKISLYFKVTKNCVK